MVVTTTDFENLTRSVADTLGLPDARIAVVPHPLGGTDPSIIESWADDAIEAVISLLTAS